MENEKFVYVNNRKVAIAGERNLLELIRKTGIDIPTFCYHSELSIYGACRLCLVEVEGRGIMASCSTAPEEGMKVHTDTAALRKMRKINVELLLANHKRECPSCSRSANCALQDIARKLGVEEVRYKQTTRSLPIDDSSPSLVRDPNKCVLCGDCVRVCSEVQTVGALDFINRGSKAIVAPAFGKNLGDVECVNCGQCAQVCPTGAIVPKSNIEQVWDAIHNPEKLVVVQIAPAVRVGLGEYFGVKEGEDVSRKMVSALRMMGFDRIYDTCFAADMTIFEEATELIERIGGGGKMPMFTSCCPGWIKFCEVFYPELLGNLSSTRSPQQIFGSVARKTLPVSENIKPENLVVVSIMPCTAKKFEAQLPKFATDGRQDVDYVLTTIEVAQMLDSMGVDLKKMEPDVFDMPLGFSTGGGVIFGATGGVMEAALRYAVEKLTGQKLLSCEFKACRGLAGRKEANLKVSGKDVRIAIVNGLGNARKLIEDMKAGKVAYDFIEVMACPGGCVAGGGQPIPTDSDFRCVRAAGLYKSDRERQLQKPQENYLVQRCYEESFGGNPGSHEAHEKLHTHYQSRNQIFDARIPVLHGTKEPLLPVWVTICTRQQECDGMTLLAKTVQFIRENGYEDRVDVQAAFSSRPEADGTLAVSVDGATLERTKSLDEVFAQVQSAIKAALK